MSAATSVCCSSVCTVREAHDQRLHASHHRVQKLTSIQWGMCRWRKSPEHIMLKHPDNNAHILLPDLLCVFLGVRKTGGELRRQWEDANSSHDRSDQGPSCSEASALTTVNTDIWNWQIQRKWTLYGAERPNLNTNYTNDKQHTHCKKSSRLWSWNK